MTIADLNFWLATGNVVLAWLTVAMISLMLYRELKGGD